MPHAEAKHELNSRHKRSRTSFSANNQGHYLACKRQERHEVTTLTTQQYVHKPCRFDVSLSFTMMAFMEFEQWCPILGGDFSALHSCTPASLHIFKKFQKAPTNEPCKHVWEIQLTFRQLKQQQQHRVRQDSSENTPRTR
eukprot:2576126-Amphidinium_carterae.2